MWQRYGKDMARQLFMDSNLGHDGVMFVVVLGMFLSVGLAVVVLFVVAVPARREGREMLTPKGEDLVSQVRDRTGDAFETAREKTGDAFDAARDKVADVTRANQD